MSELFVNGRRYAIDGILFDKDGTLLDFVSMWGSWGDRMLDGFRSRLASLGLRPAPLDPSLWGTLHAGDGGIYDYDRNGPLAMGTLAELFTLLTWQGYRAGLSWAKAKEVVELCRIAADEELDRGRPVLPMPGVAAFLEACGERQIPLGVVTADDTAAAEKHLEWLGIRRYFAVVIGNDLVARGKPFPDMLELACRKLSLRVERTVVIGDTNGDMRMGKAAGAGLCIGLASQPPERGEPAELFPDADVLVESYSSLTLRRGSGAGLEHLENSFGGEGEVQR